MQRALILYLCSLLFFGSNGIVAGQISMTSYDLVLLRTLIGSAFLFLLYMIIKHSFTFYKYPRDLLFVSLSGVGMGGAWLCLYEAYHQIGVSVSSLLFYCGPVIVMALSPLLFHEKLTRVKVIGFIVVLCGVLFINGGSAGELNVLGIACGVGSALFYAVMVICNKKSQHLVGFENSLIQLVVSFLTAAVFVGIVDGYHIQVQAEDWPWIIVLGIVNTGIGCYLYFSSIGSLPVQTVAICGYLEPLSAVIFSMIFLGEMMTPLQIVGAVLIVGGALPGVLQNSRTPKPDVQTPKPSP